MAAAPALARARTDPWKQASRDYVVRLPVDHVSHPAYRIEWWYYTGNLETDSGRRFGYQMTFFRIGIDPSPGQSLEWSVRDLLMAHIAVTDAAGGRHLFAERVSRAGVGWAGASQRDLRVWNDDWEVRLEYGRHRLQARDPRFAIDLLLERGRPPVLHGERGFSQKGSSAGNATHYYSLTRMPTEGFITLDGERFAVKGDSWMDHEFGTSFLEKTPAGVGLVLDPAGRWRGPDDVPVATRRRQPRSAEQRHARAAGPARVVGWRGGFTLTPGRLWRSPASRRALSGRVARSLCLASNSICGSALRSTRRSSPGRGPA